MSEVSEDLVTWLRSQIADAERTAHKAGPDVLGWATYRHEDGTMRYTSPVAGSEGLWFTAGEETTPTSVMEVYDPASVLAQCEAHTALLDLAHLVLGADRRNDLLRYQMLRGIALAYQHNPGYREEWRPEL